MSKTTYSSEDGRKVIATVSGTSSELKRKHENDIRDCIRILNNFLTETSILNDVYEGKSMCHERDTFDEKKGYLLAAKRADLKYEKDRYHTVESSLLKVSKILNTITVKEYGRYLKAEESLKELYNELISNKD